MSKSQETVAPIAAPEETDFQKAQEREQIRPAHTFKGQELFPYTRGTRALWSQVSAPNDSQAYTLLSFLFIHLHPRRDMVRLCWDIHAFRELVINWRDTLNDQDEKEADKIVAELLEADRKSEVEIIPQGGKKKRKPSRPAT